MKKIILFLLVLFSAIWLDSGVNAAIIVGRISNVEGQIYRYMDVDDSWVETYLQSPAGIEDILATGDDSRAEIAFPNNQLVRLDESTEIEILNLDDDAGEFTLHSGLARFYNSNPAGTLKIETARGWAAVDPGSVIDVLVDKQTVTVVAVHGEAVFHSYQDGAETEEVISGSTSLEFQEKSIVAGIGPIDRKWDRWCGDREEVLTRNSMVRSEHLPESMQEYAYTLEPYGRWERIYYRGYYYWGWKPHSVAVGWSPYTTGYWDDWRGSSVWIDYNPWGWATHHHGHWVNMHGSWLWTPYVHVSNVPGVTVIGFNITFGNGYRSHWHPGRVRWIAYNDNIGWLPLAPWETYYGYRKWGPGTVVMRPGVSLSINIDLSSHRYINHAVIVPKHHLYNRKAREINYYNTVKIRNINKTTIVKNYKPLETTERLQEGRHLTKVAGNRDIEKRIESRRGINTGKTRDVIRSEKQGNERIRSSLAKRNIPEERTVTKKYEKDRLKTIEKNRSGTIENNRTGEGGKATREMSVRSERRSLGNTVEKKENAILKSRVAENETVKKGTANLEKKKRNGNEARQRAQVETSRTRIAKQENRAVTVNKNSQAERKAAARESQVSQGQVQRNQIREEKANKENSVQARANREPEKSRREKQTAGNVNYSSEKNGSREDKLSRQRSGREWYSASIGGRKGR